MVGDSSICFINCHLAAGQNAVRYRSADVAGILEEKAVFSPTIGHPMAYIGGNDGTSILDHEFVIVSLCLCFFEALDPDLDQVERRHEL